MQCRRCVQFHFFWIGGTAFHIHFLERGSNSFYFKQILQKELLLKLFCTGNCTCFIFLFYIFCQSGTRIDNNKSFRFLSIDNIQVPHTERSILSPFTKEFRV